MEQVNSRFRKERNPRNILHNMAEEYVANGFSKCSGKKEKILLISRLHYVNIAAVGLPFVE
jgi:hypothetical protein